MIHEGSDKVQPVERPARCPVCRSVDLTTTSKVVDSATYWRCQACGEVWNAARRTDGWSGGRRP